MGHFLPQRIPCRKVGFGSLAEPHDSPKAALQAAGLGGGADLAIRYEVRDPNAGLGHPVPGITWCCATTSGWLAGAPTHPSARTSRERRRFQCPGDACLSEIMSRFEAESCQGVLFIREFDHVSEVQKHFSIEERLRSTMQHADDVAAAICCSGEASLEICGPGRPLFESFRLFHI